METVIGITCEWINNRISIDQEYVQAIIQTGSRVLLLPPFGFEDLKEVTRNLDGILVTGGQDIDPFMYGCVCKEKTTTYNRERDRFEKKLILTAINEHIPVMGICRGMQMINVALMGKLYQDYTYRKGTSNHYQKEDFNIATHKVILRKGFWLHDVLEKDVIETNSLHHQMVYETNDNLISIANSKDGVVEAVIGRCDCFVLGLQWHPERMLENVSMRKIFFAFKNEIKKQGDKKDE